MSIEAPRLTVSLLGPLDARIAGEPITTFEYAKVRALLALLVTEAPRSLTRERLCALLWPDRPERPARQSLSQALAQLRRALRDRPGDDSLILATPEAIGLNPAGVEPASCRIEVDVWRFQSLIEASERHVHRDWHLCAPCAVRLRDAVALYRGDFLSELHVVDSLPFEDWVAAERGLLRQQMLTALERLMRYAEWRDDGAEAIACARRLVAAEPWIEANHRELVRLLAVNGQRSAALSHLADLRRGLRSELATEPEEATEALARAVEAGDRMRVVSRAQAAPIRLPAPPTELIGRDVELEALTTQIRENGARLITLCGPAGVGKTRLALEAAVRLRWDYADGAAFVDLSALSGADEVPGALARALAVPQTPRQSAFDGLRAHLRDNHLLLVIDNLEHVVDAAAQLAELLAASHWLTMLTTSRVPLAVRAERVFPLDPLALPDTAAAPGMIGAAGAVRLLVSRLQASRPAFRLTDETAPEAAELCRRLDGLPLAIELVAANSAADDLRTLIARLESGGLQALETGPRDLPDRQRTLRRALRWSHDRLCPADQRVFAWLSVFADGFADEAAAAVIEPSGDLAPALARLRASSLLRSHPGHPTRSTWLETVRAFALEQLEASGEAAAARRRHATHCLALARQAHGHLEGPDQATWFERLAQDHANFQAALHWCAAHDRALGIELSLALTLYWRSRGHVITGRGWLQTLLTGESLPADVRAQALVSACRLAWAHGDVGVARQLAEQACAGCAQAKARPAYAEALALLGDLEARVGEAESARRHLEESLALYRDQGLLAGEAEAVHFLSRLATTQGDYARGITLGLDAQALYRQLGNPRKVAGQGLNLGVYAFEQGDYATALRLTTESLAVFRELGDVTGVAIALLNLGNTRRELGDLKGARLALDEAVVIERQRHGRALASVLGALGEVLMKAGDPTARDCLGESLRLRLRSGDPNGLAITLELLARSHFDIGRADLAARLVGAADAVRTAGKAPLHPNRRADHERFVSRLNRDLGEIRFRESMAAGSALTREQAVALALEA